MFEANRKALHILEIINRKEPLFDALLSINI